MTAFSPASEILSFALRDVRMAHSMYGQWAGNNAHGTQVPRWCLDDALRQWESLKQLDIRRELQLLESQFSELAACRRMIHSDMASEPQKREIIPRVTVCLRQLRAEIERLMGDGTTS
jgi:hypothetical protein